MVFWDEREEIEDLKCIGVYSAWWEAHRPIHLIVLGALEADEIAFLMDEIVGDDGDDTREGGVVGGAWI